jgi:hypothetical protein
VRTTNQQTATRARKQPQAKWEQEVYKTAIQAKCEQQINKQPQGLGHSHENKKSTKQLYKQSANNKSKNSHKG